jgi:hypothetical protein
MPNERYVKKCYLMMFNGDIYIHGHKNWVSMLRHVLQSNGFGNVWESQGVGNETHFINTFINRLKDQYLQDWTGAINSNSKLCTYFNKFKQFFSYEKYFDVPNIRKIRYIYMQVSVVVHMTLRLKEGVI